MPQPTAEFAEAFPRTNEASHARVRDLFVKEKHMIKKEKKNNTHTGLNHKNKLELPMPLDQMALDP